MRRSARGARARRHCTCAQPQRAHPLQHARRTEGAIVATGPCVSVAEGAADSEAHKRLLCECDLVLQFVAPGDALFSASADALWHGFSHEAMRTVGPAADKYLAPGEALVTGAAWTPCFVAYMAGSPGAVVGFKTEAPPDLTQKKLADVMAAGCKMHVHIGSALMVIERDLVGMYAVKNHPGAAA